MTRIDTGALVARPTPVSVRAIIDDTVAALRPQMADHAIVVTVADDLPDVEADQLLIGQVLANLLDNASRHAPSRSVITVAAEMRGDRVALAVTDSGPGVPADERDAIFDRFVRFDTGGRTGLGLTIARTFVEAHGGRIWIEDNPAGGARFVFTLSPVNLPTATGSEVVG